MKILKCKDCNTRSYTAYIRPRIYMGAQMNHHGKFLVRHPASTLPYIASYEDVDIKCIKCNSDIRPTDEEDKMSIDTCIGYNNDEPIYVEVKEEVHPMFMGYIDGEEVWTSKS